MTGWASGSAAAAGSAAGAVSGTSGVDGSDPAVSAASRGRRAGPGGGCLNPGGRRPAPGGGGGGGSALSHIAVVPARGWAASTGPAVAVPVEEVMGLTLPDP